uniref:hypothetical protein n=1 Tax=Novosphingobium sp. TaxID=1874826 RepID=UPI0025D4524F
GRYLLLKCAVSLALFFAVLLPFLYLTGFIASLMPKAAAPVAFGLMGLVWIVGMALGTHRLTEKLSKRWSK